MKIENTNKKEYQAVRIISFFPILLLVVLIAFSYLTVQNNQVSMESIIVLLTGFMLMFIFLNYLVNLAKTRFYTLEIGEDEVVYCSNRYTSKYSRKDLVKILYLNQKDFSGTTSYIILSFKSKYKKIIISNYKTKKLDFSEIMQQDLFSDCNKRTVNNNLLSQLVVLFNLIKN